jgi:predicted RNase H-like nuclease
LVIPAGCGVDGCRGGWFYFLLQGDHYQFGVTPGIRELVDEIDFGLALIDIPIGLPDAEAKPRGCDQLARRLLGPRRSSVFSPPIREVLGIDSYAEANGRSKALSRRGLSRQSFNITPKIAQVDALLRSRKRLRTRLREAHPELCFWGLAGGEPMAFNKKTEDGFAERVRVLARHWPQAEQAIAEGRDGFAARLVARDDVVDALALAITAMQPKDQLQALNQDGERDTTGLPMEMVYFQFP